MRSFLLTDCITLSPLTDDDLMAALDGEADGQIQSHLQACAYCSARLEHMRRFEQGMHTIMYRADCPSANELADYVMGVDTFDSQQYTENHLQNCVLCREEMQALQMVLLANEEVMEEESISEPIWQQVKGWIQNFEDQLVTVLMPQQLLATAQLKGVLKQGDVLSYEQGSVTVMLKLEKIVDGLKFNGTILDMDSQDEGRWAGGHAELMNTQQERFLAVVDDN